MSDRFLIEFVKPSGMDMATLVTRIKEMCDRFSVNILNIIIDGRNVTVADLATEIPPQPPAIPKDWQWWRLPRDLPQWAKFGFLIPPPETFVDTGVTVFELYWRPSEQYAYVLQDRRRIQTSDAAPPPLIINMPENDMLVSLKTPDWFINDRSGQANQFNKPK